MTFPKWSEGKQIMRRILLIAIIILMPLIGMAYTSPGKPTGFVNDFANVLTAQNKQAIGIKLQLLKQTTNAEVSVVTIYSLGNDETIETYATKLFQEWGIGVKGKDYGLLILVAPNDKQARIEVGYGLEGSITDIQSGIIVRNVMIPAFKTGDYSKGISGAVDAVAAVITKSPEAVRYLQDTSANNSGSSSDSNISYIAIFIFIIIINALAKILGKTKSWWLGGVIGVTIGTIIGLIWGFIFAGIGSIVILTILGFIFDYFVSKNPPKSGGPGGFLPIFFGGGRGGFGGGGGGFGGFGGGMSGGGGASGRW